MSERDLELLLERTAASMAYPATPQLRGRVLGAIATETRSVERPKRPAFAFATIAAAIAVFAAMIALAVPGSRSAIAEFFGIEGSKIERAPTPAPGTTATPLPTAVSLPETARPARIGEIEAALGFNPVWPGREAPASYLVQYGADSLAILRFREFDLWQSRLESVTINKEISPDVVVEEFVLENGAPARWVTGGSYVLVVRGANGEEIDASFRVIDRSTLIWRTERAFYRIETELDRDEAVAIAESLP